MARLTLIGNVIPGADEWARYPYAMGKLRLKQNQLEFREVAAGKQPSERILCGNSGDKPMRLSALIIPKFATFRTEPEVIQPGSESRYRSNGQRIAHSRGKREIIHLPDYS